MSRIQRSNVKSCRASLIVCCQQLLALSIIVSPLVACTQTAAMYEGDRLDADAVATLTRQTKVTRGFFSFDQNTNVEKVDGAKPPGLPFHAFQDLQLLPGRHTVSLDLKRTTIICGSTGCLEISIAKPSITFVAEAGHRYCLPAFKRKKEIWAWVVDGTAGETVAGLEPDQFETTCYCTIPLWGRCNLKKR